MRWMRILCVAFAVLACAAEGRAAWVFVDAFKHSEPFFETGIQVELPGVAGVTGVRAVRADGTPLALEAFSPEAFGARLGPFGSFGAFHSATVGNWQLIVELGAAGEAVYDMAVNDFRTPFTTDSFLPTPTVLSPPDGATGVSPTPTFVWDNGGPHTGALENLFVSVASEADPAVGVFESSTGGPITLDAETWTPPIVLPEGPASFLVQYETNENEDPNVDDPIFNAAASTAPDPGITWSGSSGDLHSRDLIEFNAVPEPTTLALFLLGHWAVYARLRSRRGPS